VEQTVAIRAPHDLVSLTRRIKAAGESLGLPARDVRRFAAASYEMARLLTSGATLDAETHLTDHQSLQVLFRVSGLNGDRAALRRRVEQGAARLQPLVHEIEIRDTDEGLSVCLESLVPTGESSFERSAPDDDVAANGDGLQVPDESLREQYTLLQRDYRDLVSELQDTNSGVVALYAELEGQANRLRRVEDDLRRRAEELAAANRAKEDFLATLSHELRTPLNAMLGWTRLLRMGKLDSDAAARALETIERNARAQEQLIADILDLSRIVTGKLRIELTPIDLAQVVEAAVDTVRPAAEAKGIRLTSQASFFGTVLGDPDRLQQVVWNLLVNAIKFTPAAGQVTIAVTRDGPNATMTVTDSGEGISQELLPFVFDRFSQGDRSATRPHGGLGLGLSIVRHIVELHGGTVDARSSGQGEGATFVVHLPMRVEMIPQPESAARTSR
jgi:signal transduction histidine kinase